MGLVLDKTCFYSESGGQVGDNGVIESDKGRFVVEGTVKTGCCVIHQGQLIKGALAVSEKVIASISKERQAIKRNSKSVSSKELLGCTVNQCKIHLEKQFQIGMSWENYGVYG